MSLPRRILIEGGGRLAAAILRRLEGARVTVERITITEEGDSPTVAKLANASVLVFAADDDAGNVDRALWARRVRPDLPLVVRIFDEALARYVAGTVQNLTILSMSQVAAPVFAEAALKLLGEAAAAPPGHGKHHRQRRLGPDRFLLGVLLGLALLVIVATSFFAVVLKLRFLDALYFVWTTVMTVGYGDITLAAAPDGAKVVGMLLMLAGGAFMATLFAFVTGWVVTRRMEVLAGRVRIRAQGHILIAGAGNLGFRVARRLAAAGKRVVIIERDTGTHNVAALRADGHHVVIADAANDDVLDLAGVDHAGAVLALTNSDAVNLEIALLVRARGGPAKVVMRGVSPELCAHVSERGDGIALSPVAIATESFAQVILAG